MPTRTFPYGGFMGCVVCGSSTKSGSLLCSKCFGRLGEPVSLVPRLMDPNADQRLVSSRSAAMMIGPLVSPEVKFSKGTEPALTFRTMLTDQDKSRIPSYVDMYLDGVGVPLHLTGFERIPKRELISSIIWNCETLEFDTEFWAKACLRIGNLYALSTSRTRYLAVDQKELQGLLHKHTELARKFYSHSSRFPKLDRVAQGNSALLGHWVGESERAIDILEDLIANQITSESVPFVVQGAIVLLETGQMERAKDALSTIPDKLRSPLANRMLASMGVPQ
jgi:hypothetical protein